MKRSRLDGWVMADTAACFSAKERSYNSSPGWLKE